jgi:hypothetical protein
MLGESATAAPKMTPLDLIPDSFLTNNKKWAFTSFKK